MLKAISSLLAVVAVCAYGINASAEVVMDTVTVGNPGNPDDTHGSGYGGVDYTYNIGKYEVTAGQYTEFLNAVAATDAYGLYNASMWSSADGCKIERSGSSGSYIYSVAPDWANRPVNYVSWGDAARFSNWLYNGQPSGPQGCGTTEDGSYILDGASADDELMAIDREPGATWVIPSEDEWYKAAYHKNDGVTGDYFDFPTRSDSAPSNDLVDPDPGNNANFYQSGYTIGSPYWRTEVGEFEASDSPYGTFDQGGNAWEWNEAIRYGSCRSLRGGAFSSHGGLHSGTEYLAEYPTCEHDGFGFRVLRVADVPSSCNGDFDGDNDVDLDDFGAFAGCMAGPKTPPPPSSWNCADLDDDSDVDLADFVAFQLHFTGQQP